MFFFVTERCGIFLKKKIPLADEVNGMKPGLVKWVFEQNNFSLFSLSFCSLRFQLIAESGLL
jgi:hypothetical protein